MHKCDCRNCVCLGEIEKDWICTEVDKYIEEVDECGEWENDSQLIKIGGKVQFKDPVTKTLKPYEIVEIPSEDTLVITDGKSEFKVFWYEVYE